MPEVRGHAINVWRDYEAAAVALAAGMSLGSTELAADGHISAVDLFAAGARHVTFDSVVDLHGADPAGTVRALAFIRDLTSCGIVVGWELRLESSRDDWQELSHLYPPARVISDRAADGGELQSQWSRRYHVAKCVFRRGPGLLQVRDRRWDGLRRVTITRPDHLAAVALLANGVPAENVPAAILADFFAARLIGLVGDLTWWLPYRVRRWPNASTVI
jgi:hypothetical protein